MPLEIAYRPVPQLPLPEDLRPRDFEARIRRRDALTMAHSLRPARARRQRAWGMLGVILLGMILGPIGWGGGPIDAAQAAGGRTAMPFETAGENFPGSAYYYMDQSDSGVLAPKAAEAAWDDHRYDESFASAASPAGPAARPLLSVTGPEDRSRAIQCLTSAIYYEAASEPDAGQRAVAQVVLNRVAHPSYPNTVCGVVFQGSEMRTGCQFSFTCDGSLARKPMLAFWERARRIASEAMAGYVYAPVGLATHYHTTAIHPYWADSLAYIGTIGAHRFYRWAGAAGRPAAFNAVYAGREPIPAPHPRSWTPEPATAFDPVQLARAYEAALPPAERAAIHSDAAPAPAATPQYAPALQQRGGEALFRAQGLEGSAPTSGSGAVRPEYENAGKWIAQPAG
jgi:hypothetical protein